MKVFFLGKKIWLTIGCSLLAVCLVVLGVSLILPDAEETTAEVQTPEPYRSGAAESSCISLGINVDWGEEYIPDMLRVFAEEGIPVTFFLTGRWADNNPELAAETERIVTIADGRIIREEKGGGAK